eukprot:s7326_g2.t1
MKSVAGSLAWVCRQCRPDLSYRVSRIQSASNNGTVADIKEANKTVEYAVKTYQRGITFRSGLLDWSKPGGLMSLVITDASHANEEEELLVNGSVSVEYHRSQGARMIFVATPSLWDEDKGSVHPIAGARMIFVATPSLWDEDKGSVHPIAWASNIVRRVCRSTIQAEAYTLQAGVEDGDVLRAAVADLFGALDLKRWEASAAKFMRQIWFTDCKSLEETLKNPKCSKHSDKRLSIEIAFLRQDLWRKKGEEAGVRTKKTTVRATTLGFETASSTDFVGPPVSPMASALSDLKALGLDLCTGAVTLLQPSPTSWQRAV